MMARVKYQPSPLKHCFANWTVKLDRISSAFSASFCVLGIYDRESIFDKIPSFAGVRPVTGID